MFESSIVNVCYIIRKLHLDVFREITYKIAGNRRPVNSKIPHLTFSVIYMHTPFSSIFFYYTSLVV